MTGNDREKQYQLGVYVPHDCKQHDNQEDSEQASHCQYQDDGTKQQAAPLSWRQGGGGGGGDGGCVGGEGYPIS